MFEYETLLPIHGVIARALLLCDAMSSANCAADASFVWVPSRTMPIELTPENQRLIDDAIRSGAYSTPEQVIGRALEVLSLEDEWLPERRLAIDEKIASGLAQLDRGEGIPGDQAHAALQSRKVNFLAQQSTTR